MDFARTSYCCLDCTQNILIGVSYFSKTCYHKEMSGTYTR